MNKLRLPLTAQLELTYECNYRCQHCYLLDSERNDQKAESPDEKVMEIARRLVGAGVFNVILTGGEPLTRPDLLKRLIGYLDSQRVNVMVNTNLSLLTEDMLQCFLEHHVRNILVSCPSGLPGEYNEITKTHSAKVFERKLRMLSASGQRYSINMVVNQLNKHSVIATAMFVKSCGCHNFGATPMALNPLYPRKDLLLSKEEVRQLLTDLKWIHEELGMNIDVMEALPKCAIPDEMVRDDIYFTKRKCQAGITVCAVSPDGDVRPCTHNTRSYGNILDTPLEDIWDSMREWRDMSLVPAGCKKCKLLARCQGGCRINALTMHGRMDADDIWTQHDHECPMVKVPEVKDLSAEMELAVTPAGLRVRPEKDGMFMVCGSNGRQAAYVSGEVVKLLDLIQEAGKMSVSEIAALGDMKPTDNQVQEILRHLTGRRILRRA